MPELYVIAGPNGAGKSTYSKDIVPKDVFIFDADKELANELKLDPNGSVALIYNSIISKMTAAIKEAISQNKSFAYETNLVGYDAMHTPKLFKDNGYTTNLIFVGLEHAETCKMRVKLRVEKGLHNVDPKTIEERFEKSKNNIDKGIALFDKVLLSDNSQTNTVNNIHFFAKFEKGQLIERDTITPEWADKSVKSLQQETPIKSKDKELAM